MLSGHSKTRLNLSQGSTLRRPESYCFSLPSARATFQYTVGFVPFDMPFNTGVCETDAPYSRFFRVCSMYWPVLLNARSRHILNSQILRPGFEISPQERAICETSLSLFCISISVCHLSVAYYVLLPPLPLSTTDPTLPSLPSSPSVQTPRLPAQDTHPSHTGGLHPLVYPY